MKNCIFLFCFIILFSSSPVYSKFNREEYPDNWGSPVHPVEKYNGMPLKELTKNCDWGWKKFTNKMEGATLNWYKSSEDWIKFKGYDLVPENNNSYERFEWWNLDRTTYGSPIKGGRCTVNSPDNDGSTWVFERIGPFKSEGNYDWWQFAWDNPFQASDILKRNPQGFYILNYFSGAVNLDGDTLGYPPIHIHHVHATPSPYNYYRVNRFKCFLGQDDHCSNSINTIFEQHGDYQCQPNDGGTGCLLENFPRGYARLVQGPMNINGELNDVRPINSEPIEWYYETAMRWIPRHLEEEMDQIKYNNEKDNKNHAKGNQNNALSSKFKPLSLHYMWSPGRMNIVDQSTLVNTFKTPTNEDSLLWYSGKLHFNGSLIRGKMHTHNVVFKESFLFAAHPNDIGFDLNKFYLNKEFETISIKDLGYSSTDELTDYIFENFERNKKEGKNIDLICYGSTDNEQFKFPTGNFRFDRRAPTWCKEWDFKEGTHFIVVGYNRKVSEPPSLHRPHMIPEFIPGHIHWFLSYDAEDNTSHYEYAFYSRDPENSFTGSNSLPLGGKINMFTFLVNKGIPSRLEWWLIVIFVFAFCTVVNLLVLKLFKSKKPHTHVEK